MSVPAREATVRVPRTLTKSPAPSPVPSRAPIGQPQRRPAPTRRPRRPVHAGYLVFAGVVVSALIVGVVALNALLAQAAFATRAAQSRLDDLRREQVQLTHEAAQLSSPGVVATWARRHGMVVPAAGNVNVLRLSGSGR